MQYATPPPARAAAQGALRVRRSSVPSSRHALAVESAVASAAVPSEPSNSSADPAAALPAQATAAATATALRTRSKSREPSHAQTNATAATDGPTASSVVRPGGPLFAAHEPKRERAERCELIAALQQSGVALSALHEREKMRSELLRTQVEQLTAELRCAAEALAEERTKSAKVAALRSHTLAGDASTGRLPDIHALPAAAALQQQQQQQAQLEISYQRRILSLEGRCKDLMANNSKLLSKIQQLEQTEADAGAQLDALRHENTRLATQTDSLSSTVAAQSALVIGLRTTVQRLSQDEQTQNALMKQFDRSQHELEAARTRERLLRAEHETLQAAFSNEKELLMAKVLASQRELQLRTAADDAVELAATRTRALEASEHALQTRVAALLDDCARTDARLHEQEAMANRFLCEKQQRERDCEQLEIARAGLELELNALQARLARSDELDTLLQAAQHQFDAALAAKDSEVNALMRRVVDAESAADALQRLLDTRNRELETLRSDVSQCQQLSQDETVQALQLARTKAAGHDALRLLEDEKRELVDRIDALVADHANALNRADEQRAVLAASLDAANVRLQDRETHAIKPNEPIEPNELVEPNETNEAIKPAGNNIPETVRGRLEGNRMQLEAEIAELRVAYAELQESYRSVEAEYTVLVTKKYKTESFQSQVRLLQHENSELADRLERVCSDLARDRADLAVRTREVVDLKLRVLDPHAVTLLRQTQESLERTVSELVATETAAESAFTCLACLQLFVDPMTLAPCGHTYCMQCLAAFGDVDEPATITCKDCTSHSSNADRVEAPDAVFPNHALADLTARFLFRQQSLASLTTMCLSLRNSFADRSTVAS